MKTNAQFDEAWRQLQVAYRSEDLDLLDAASERLTHAVRMMQLDRQLQVAEQSKATTCCKRLTP